MAVKHFPRVQHPGIADLMKLSECSNTTAKDVHVGRGQETHGLCGQKKKTVLLNRQSDEMLQK